MKKLRKYLKSQYGRQSELARELGVSPGAVHQWAKGRVPVKRIYEVALLTGIPAAEIRPDIEKQRRKAS